MFWIICLLVFIGILIALGFAMSRSLRAGGTGVNNHDALQKGAAQAYGHHNEGGFGGGV